MYGSSSSTCKFKRYSLLDLFDEQYGHLQRNEMLDNQEQQERAHNVHHNSPSSQNNQPFLNLFIVGE